MSPGGTISASIFAPDIVVGSSYTPRGSAIFDTPLPLENYSHRLTSFLGFDSSRLSFKIVEDQVDDWIRGGLNRHIEVYSSDLQEIWSGFVNQIQVQAGRKTITLGPLLDHPNRVSAVYTRLFTDTTPPTSGGKWTTTIAEDSVIQARYGIIEKVLSLGQTTLDRAEDIRDLYLSEHKNPLPGEDVAFDSGQTFRVSLDCLGYMHKLSAYIYEDATSYTVQLDTRLQDVFEADPNFLWGAGADYSAIASNALLIPGEEDNERIALDVLKWLVSHGDASGNSYSLGVFRRQKIRYTQVDDQIFYVYNTAEATTELHKLGGEIVAPWNVRPGRWLLFADYLPGQNFPTIDPNTDPRAILINTVDYEAPYGLRVNGEKVSELSQRLVQWGLGASV